MRSSIGSLPHIWAVAELWLWGVVHRPGWVALLFWVICDEKDGGCVRVGIEEGERAMNRGAVDLRLLNYNRRTGDSRVGESHGIREA